MGCSLVDGHSEGCELQDELKEVDVGFSFLGGDAADEHGSVQ